HSTGRPDVPLTTEGTSYGGGLHSVLQDSVSPAFGATIIIIVTVIKAYDRVPREELWYCMRKSGVAEKYVRVVQDMYERSRTVVRCAVGQTEEFNVEVGLHQGSALSPFLFAIVMDQLSEEVRRESPWTMMFADDIVICSESREQVEENLERWRFALERRGMKVSRSKTEYMCVNEREGSGTVRLQGEEVKKVQEFKYLRSPVQSNGECGKEVKKRVQAETVSLWKRQESELEVAELKMLRFSLGVTRLDRIRNEYIRGTAHVGRLGDKVREARLRWFGHVQRRERGTDGGRTDRHWRPDTDMAGFLDNFRWPECECIDWGEKRNTVASIVAGILDQLDGRDSAIFCRMVGYDRRCYGLLKTRGSQSCFSHVWSFLNFGFFHDHSLFTLNSTVEKNNFGRKKEDKTLVYMEYITRTLVHRRASRSHMINAVSNAHVYGDTYGEGCLGQTGARVWLFIGFLIMFASLIASIWILFAAYVSPGLPVYPGLCVFFQNLLIFFRIESVTLAELSYFLFIHSLCTAYPIYSRVTGSLCLSQASLGIKAGYTLDGVPTHRRAHTHSHSHTTDNLEMPINLQCMSLDLERKPE
ncbi:hypothetical protein QTP70_018076, partial [Hemibagrus guttatus]